MRHLSRLERAILIAAGLVICLTVLTSFDVLPRRSVASMAVGFLMLNASALELILVPWLAIRNLLLRKAFDRYATIVVLVGILSAAPILLTIWRF